LSSGDSIIDHYLYGIIKRQSPEDPAVPVVDFVEEEYKPGGALNVATNIKTLSKRGATVYVSSIFSDFTTLMLKQKKLFYDEKVLSAKDDKKPHPRELIKTRIVNSETGKQLVRIDNREKFSESDLQRYKNKCYYNKFVEFDAIVVSDYNKGLIDEALIKSLAEVKCPVFVDTKKKDLSIWKNIEKCFIKINSKEFQNSQKAHEVKHLIVTEGDRGSAYYQEGVLDSFYKTDKVEDADVTGAGDVFLSAFVVAYLENEPMDECLRFANKAALISVKKYGTSEVSRNEVQ
jgi:rfaE bifunctional protein kinase chain/domain